MCDGQNKLCCCSAQRISAQPQRRHAYTLHNSAVHEQTHSYDTCNNGSRALFGVPATLPLRSSARFCSAGPLSTQQLHHCCVWRRGRWLVVRHRHANVRPRVRAHCLAAAKCAHRGTKAAVSYGASPCTPDIYFRIQQLLLVGLWTEGLQCTLQNVHNEAAQHSRFAVHNEEVSKTTSTRLLIRIVDAARCVAPVRTVACPPAKCHC